MKRSVRDLAVAKLESCGVDEQLSHQLPKIPDKVTALLLYGSQARGDATPDSDVDILGMVTEPIPSISDGKFSFSFYTSRQLHSAKNTLFGMHLSRDAKIIWDTKGELKNKIDAMGSLDVERLFDRLHTISQLLTNKNQDYPKYKIGLSRLARYLLRSGLYAKAIQEGAPCFSVRELADRLEDPPLVELLASRPSMEVTEKEYDECCRRIENLLEGLPQSKHGSLESTVVNEWEQGGDLLSASFLAIDRGGDIVDYSEVETILL